MEKLCPVAEQYGIELVDIRIELPDEASSSDFAEWKPNAKGLLGNTAHKARNLLNKLARWTIRNAKLFWLMFIEKPNKYEDVAMPSRPKSMRSAMAKMKSFMHTPKLERLSKVVRKYPGYSVIGTEIGFLQVFFERRMISSYISKEEKI